MLHLCVSLFVEIRAFLFIHSSNFLLCGRFWLGITLWLAPMLRPFRALRMGGYPNPGRCPGLVCRALSGLIPTSPIAVRFPFLPLPMKENENALHQHGEHGSSVLLSLKIFFFGKDFSGKSSPNHWHIRTLRLIVVPLQGTAVGLSLTPD
jgi:hypothetical protein